MQVNKYNNQVIPLKLQGVTFTVCTKDNIDKKFNKATKSVFQSMKSVHEGIARRHSHNGLVGTIGDFSLNQSYTYVPPTLKKYKEYSCALPTANIPKYIWCELKQLKLVLKTHGGKTCAGKTCAKNVCHAGKTCAYLCTLE